jgi:iron complex outermembrane receptor protein
LALNRQLTPVLVFASVLFSRHVSAGGKEQSYDELDLVELLNIRVSTATKTSEVIDDAPAVITVVTRDDIHRWGYRNIGEVLMHCVGFFSVDDHIQPNVAVRGMTGGLGAESSVIKVMIDGRSVAYRTTSGNWLGAELVSLESIEQIEIIRGPASALYGADAFLGVVNIITLKPEEARPFSGRIFTGVTGTEPSTEFDMYAQGKMGRFDYGFGTVGEFADRRGLAMPKESPAPNIPTYAGERVTAQNLERRSFGAQARVGYRVADKGQMVGSVFYSAFSRGGDFAQWAQLTNGSDTFGRPTGTTLSLHQARVNWDANLFATKSLELSLRSTYFAGGVLPSDRIEFGSDFWYARRKTSYRGFDGNVEARYIPSNRYNIVIGFENIYDRESLLAPERVIRENETIVKAPGAAGRIVRFQNLGLYVSSNVWVVENWLKLTGGVRSDFHSSYGNQWTGRLGLTSRVTEALIMKLLYGSAFKAPSPYLLYARPLGPGDVLGNSKLKPQKVHTIEYQVSYNYSSSFGVSSGVAYSTLFDQAEFSPQGINQMARNSARQTTLTWETRAEVKRGEDFMAYGAFELLYSRRNLEGQGYVARLVGSTGIVYPPYLLRLGTNVALPRISKLALSLGGEGMLVGPRRAADTSVIAEGRRFDLPPYVTTNFFLMTRRLRLVADHESIVALRVYNAFGTRGPEPGFSGFEFPLAPREVLLEFRHEY